MAAGVLMIPQYILNYWYQQFPVLVLVFSTTALVQNMRNKKENSWHIHGENEVVEAKISHEAWQDVSRDLWD